MKKVEKAQLIAELSEDILQTPHIYFTDSSTMTVAHVNVLRKLCHERGIRYRVVKNSLIQKALEAQKAKNFSSLPKEVLKGFTGIFFEKESARACAQLIKEFRKRESIEFPQLKAAYVEDDIYVGESQLDPLSRLLSKEELLAELLDVLQSPMRGLLSSLRNGSQRLVQVLQVLGKGVPNE